MPNPKPQKIQSRKPEKKKTPSPAVDVPGIMEKRKRTEKVVEPEESEEEYANQTIHGMTETSTQIFANTR